MFDVLLGIDDVLVIALSLPGLIVQPPLQLFR